MPKKKKKSKSRKKASKKRKVKKRKKILKRKKNIKINFDEELNKLINIEKNKQYNQFSSIYFNKIKQNILISEI